MGTGDPTIARLPDLPRKVLRKRLWLALADAIYEAEALGEHLDVDAINRVTQEFARDVQRTVRGGR